MTQDERWDMMRTMTLDFLKRNRRRPSKYNPEERELLNWVKYNCKRMRGGKMTEQRQALLRSLLDEAERLRRVNQYEYKHKETASLFGNK